MANAHLKDWTIMVYMAGDNNLSTDMVYALEQLKMVANNDNDIFVYFDGLSSEIPTLYCDFSNSPQSSDTGSRIEFFPSYKIKEKLIDVDDEFNENSAAVDNIINFVHWCVNRDSAEAKVEKKYAFIFSGHTFGFVNQGLFKDEKANYYMTYAKLNYMFERITGTETELKEKAVKEEQKFFERYGKHWDEKRWKERTTPVVGKRLDLLGFDTCVMSTLEIACQFRKIAKTMVASEGSIPTAGWNYAQILLTNINNKYGTNPKKLAVSIVDEFIKQQNKFALADISVDISAWDLERMDALEENFEKVTDDLMTCFKDKKSAVYHQMRRLIVYAHWQCQTYLLEQHIDMGDFCQLLINEIDLLEKEITGADLSPILNVRESCRKLVESIRDCIMLTGFSGSDFQFSTGISLFFPWSWDSYLTAAQDYKKLTFIKNNNAGKKWNDFLKTYLNDVTLRVPNRLTKREDITSETVSVVFESYNLDDNPDFIDSVSTDNPGNGKQFPNSGRQFPNFGRQFPNSGRLTDQFSIFLSRFMKLKNSKSNWNRTGFTSKNVVFLAESENGNDIPSKSRPTDQIEIKIPVARSIREKFEDLSARLEKIKNNYSDKTSIENFRNELADFYKNSDERKVNKTLSDIKNLDFIKSDDQTEDDLKAGLENAFSILSSAK